MWKNLSEKYDLTPKQIEECINDLLNGGIKNVVTVNILIAITDLLANGDIPSNGKPDPSLIRVDITPMHSRSTNSHWWSFTSQDARMPRAIVATTKDEATKICNEKLGEGTWAFYQQQGEQV